MQRQRLVLVVPAGHRLAARHRVRLEEVAAEPFVTVPAGLGFRSLLDELLAAESGERVVGLTWPTDRALSPAAARFPEFRAATPVT